MFSGIFKGFFFGIFIAIIFYSIYGKFIPDTQYFWNSLWKIWLPLSFLMGLPSFFLYLIGHKWRHIFLGTIIGTVVFFLPLLYIEYVFRT